VALRIYLDNSDYSRIADCLAMRGVPVDAGRCRSMPMFYKSC
jgi:hypothetical protein